MQQNTRHPLKRRFRKCVFSVALVACLTAVGNLLNSSKLLGTIEVTMDLPSITWLFDTMDVHGNNSDAFLSNHSGLETVSAGNRSNGEANQRDSNALLDKLNGTTPNATTTTRTKTSHANSTIIPHASFSTTKKATIGYAISITSFHPTKGRFLLDGAAILHQSIKMASQTSMYDYQMIAFVHPEASSCSIHLQELGYDVQIQDTPFNISLVPNPRLVKAQNNGCCKEKEYLKLYTWVQTKYPIVVHLDLDAFVLKPMDDLFDLMLDSTSRRPVPIMWRRQDEVPRQIDFAFTRDYNMVEPPRKPPHKIGVQGGFLVVRPNRTEFEALIDVIMRGGDDYRIGSGWGGSLGYGGYYGAATIQGLASYYYGHFAPERAIELNRCFFNTMVDDPYNTEEVNEHPERYSLMCRTTEKNLTCEDCRLTPIDEINTAHFTVCGKPHWCQTPTPNAQNSQLLLCMKLFREWHRVRWSLEEDWREQFPHYDPHRYPVPKAKSKRPHYLDFYQGHCAKSGRDGYIPLKFPNQELRR